MSKNTVQLVESAIDNLFKNKMIIEESDYLHGSRRGYSWKFFGNDGYELLIPDIDNQNRFVTIGDLINLPSKIEKSKLIELLKKKNIKFEIHSKGRLNLG